MTSLLDVKLRRDVRALKSQVIAVATVMACGLAMMIMTRSLIQSLDTARSGYYEQHRFADVFAGLKRAPLSVVDTLAAIPGVAAVEPTVARSVTLVIPTMREPATGLICSLPERREPTLHLPFIRQGRLPAVGSRHEAAVSEAFASAHGLKPGDRLVALINGRQAELKLVGILLSPQFVFEAPPGSALPDPRTYGVFWMLEDEVAEAFQMKGAFNTVALALTTKAAEERVIAAVDHVLEPWGGLGAYGRRNHPSDTRVADEITVLRGLSFGFPLVFLSVGAFMTHSVLSRQITLQREQIAILKAFGFSDSTIALHFVKFALVIVVLGTVLGALGGTFLGLQLAEMYHAFFRFPTLEFRFDASAVLGALAASTFAALVGTWGAVRQVVRLAPAQAMRPEPPASFRPALAERLGLHRLLNVSVRMALRNLERRPVRGFLTMVALALATGILVVPNAFRDGIAHVLDFQWDVIARQTATLAFNEPREPRAVADLRALPGVIRAEPFRSVPVELSFGHRQRRLAVSGLQRNAQLNRLVGVDGRPTPVPTDGIVLSQVLAQALGVAVGQTVHVRVLEGRRAEFEVRVVALAEDFAGIASYMELDTLNRALGEGDRISGAFLAIAQGSWNEFLAIIKETPAAASVVIKDAVRESFRKTTAQSIGLIQMVYLVFATSVAFGIVYNSARISLSERQHELATLRVLGFSQRQVGAVLVGELVILAVTALPLGLLVGSGFAASILTTVNTETVRVPLVLTVSNYAYAVTVIVIATSLSAWLACRRLNQLDLVGALKARD